MYSLETNVVSQKWFVSNDVSNRSIGVTANDLARMKIAR